MTVLNDHEVTLVLDEVVLRGLGYGERLEGRLPAGPLHASLAAPEALSQPCP